jgi:DNA repair exonuclease SbcCD ATPase subunit
MINFKSVVLTNFMSYGQTPTTFSLSNEGTTLIIGNNEDVGDKGGSKNGAGKTQTMQAVVFALFGKGIDKLKTDEFINIKNGKKMSVELEFEKANKTYKIVRKRKPNSVEIYVDGETLTLDTMKNTDEVIQDIVGMTYDVFMTTYFLSPHREAFMSMTPANQRGMIESMLSLDVLVKRAEALKLIRKDLEVDIKVFERDLDNAARTNTNINDSIQRLKLKDQEWHTSNLEKIQSLKDLIRDIEKIDIDSLYKDLKKKEQVNDDIQAVTSDIANNVTKTSDVRTKIANLSRDKKELEKLISEIETLTKMSNEYSDNVMEKVSSVQKQLDEMDSVDELSDSIEMLVALGEVKENIKKLSKNVSESKKKLEKLESEKSFVEEDIRVLESGVCSKCGQPHKDEDELKRLVQCLADVSKLLEYETQNLSLLNIEYESAYPEFCSVLEEMGLSPDDNFEKVSMSKQRILMQVENLIKERDRLKESVNENPYPAQIERTMGNFKSVDGIGLALDEIMSQIDSNSLSLSDLEKEVESLKGKKQKLLEQKFEELDSLGIEHESQLTQLRDELDSAKSELEDYENLVSPFIDEIENLKDTLVDEEAIKNTIQEIELDVKHIGYLIKLLTDNKSFVRKNIVDSYIPFVNKKILEYTDKLGLTHVCSINNDLSTDIDYMGKAVSYFNLSQGERLRLNLSVNLAFRDMITMLGKGSNILMVDEYMDSAFDQSGLWRSFNLIKEKAKNVLIISHREEFKEFVDRTVTITKRNGFSFIE